MQLVRREHPDYEVVMLTASTAETGSLLTYVGRSALNVFGWLNWIIKTVSRSTSARILLQEGHRADIVHSPDFESGCVRVLGGSHRLTRAEKAALQSFRCVEEEPPRTTEDASSADSKDEDFFVENLQKRCRLAAIESRVARTTYGQEHHSLQPTTLEMVLFLRQNGEYWTGQDRLSMRPLVNN
ncbi:hypothetical protein PC110_g22297 [Phytophthora cactorum]|uniref:Uncharacterized protein n=1 Tax=Phytophthora cactorum TaxID=29920 RepID=A0A329RA08_9STRA|nr:hypothetical protein PC110_g22297 [Phytophthora cactorum]